MKTVLKFLKWTGILLLVLVLAGFTYVQLTWDKKFEAPYPEITASTDSAVIARGKHLAFGAAHCASCHVPMDKMKDVEMGVVMPLSGGWELPIPPGTFRAPNITPDKETGIGNLTDADLARTLRHMVGSDGRIIFPFMPFAELSDEDLTAIISFLRSQEPVKHEVPRTELTFLGKALMAAGMITPTGTKGTPPKTMPVDSSIEYGGYLANSVANCVGCHTNRDLKTGAFIGKPFAGGFYMPPDQFSQGQAFISPNLTPDPETGIMAKWDEATFILRLKNGRIHKGSPMPWGFFSRLDEVEMKALYRYLNSLEPIPNKIEKVVFEPGDPLPES